MEILKHFPPNREFRHSLFHGLVETEASKARTREWQAWMRGYSDGVKDAKAGSARDEPFIPQPYMAD
jgi:hypothetical protein